MSGFSETDKCPNCGSNNCLVMGDYKPYSHTSYECPDCGLYIYPEVEYMSLEELNEYREDMDMEPLNKLPEQNFK